MPKFAALDIGSNALRLRIVEAHAPPGEAAVRRQNAPRTQWREVLSLRAPVRLGTEVFITGKLTAASIGQACGALRDFRQAMDNEGVDVYRATATSAAREASNGPTLVERAWREAGIELEIIEGVEEARLIQLAVSRRLPLDRHRALLVDVGGGSAELTFLDRGHTTFAMSLPLGTVRLLDTFLRQEQAVDGLHMRLLVEAIDRTLNEALPELKKYAIELLVGTGGNIETLAELCPLRVASPPQSGDASLSPGEPRAVAASERRHEHAASERRHEHVDVASMRVLLARLSEMTADERRDAYGLRPDRADTILPASAIFLRLAEIFRVSSIAAPGAGLKEGILEELVDKHFNVWDTAGEAKNVLDACVRLGKRYGFDEGHAVLVSRFAAQLFDDLQALHAMTDRDKLLLQASALLHDIGDFVRYDGHHKHSYYLIQHSDIMGLVPEERAVVANLARYHRKGAPDPSHPNFRDLDKASRAKVRGLASILRIADALDREHRGKVRGARARLDLPRRRVTLTLEGTENRELEEWTVRSKAELLREVFDVTVELEPPVAPPRS